MTLGHELWEEFRWEGGCRAEGNKGRKLDNCNSIINYIYIYLYLYLYLYLFIFIYFILKPWLVCLSGLSTGLQTKGSLVRFPVRAHVWAAGQVPSGGCTRGNHTWMFLYLSFSLSSPLSKNK